MSTKDDRDQTTTSPQIGVLFPVGSMQGYLNLKGYKEFGAEHRPEGWNVWLTLQCRRPRRRTRRRRG